jgi:hypothetical protein
VPDLGRDAAGDFHAAYTRSRSAADETAWKDAKAKMYRLLERLRAAEFSGE